MEMFSKRGKKDKKESYMGEEKNFFFINTLREFSRGKVIKSSSYKSRLLPKKGSSIDKSRY